MKQISYPLFTALTILAVLSSEGAEIQKNDTTHSSLNLTSNWVGGAVPGSNDVALWDSPYNRTSSLGATLGDDLSWKGIRVVSPTTVPRIRATTGKLLTLGSSGIDMSGATQNFEIYSSTALGTSQEWNIASGRTLTINAALGGAGVTLTKAGTGNLNVNLATSLPMNIALSDGTLTIGNASGTIDLTGALSGSAALSKSAAGILTLSNDNTSYTGSISLTAGTLHLHHVNALGNGALTISGGAVGNASGNPVTLSGNAAQTWGGAVSFVGPDALHLGTTAVTVTSTTDVSVSGSAVVSMAGAMTANAGALTKSGTGTLQVNAGAQWEISGKLAVNGGMLQVNGGTLQCGNNGSAALEISGGTVELLGGETSVRSVTRPAGSGTLRFKGGVLRPRADSATFVSGLTAAEVGTGGAKIELDGWFVTIPQPLVHDPGLGGTADDGLLVKDSFGNGRLTLTGASTYTGATIIESGTLRLGAGGSIAASPVIEVQEMGTLDGQTGTTIASGQTVRGTGTMVGTVTIGAGATLSPGVAGLGAMKGDILILQGQTVMEVNKSGGMITNDSVMNLWQLTYGGTLTVTKTGEAFALGDTVELFASANYAGSFATVSLPDLPTGLFWETTGLLINGSIEVVDTLPSPNFSLTSGTYVGAQTVSITGVDGSTIRYTTDGSDPLTSGTVLSGVSPVTGIVLPLNGVPVTLRAYATLSGFTDSAVVTAVYTLLENPTWSFLGSGNWSDAAKWYGGVIANGSGVIADFSTLTLTSSNSVNLDGPRTVGGLKFGDVGNQRTWALAGSALTLAGPTQPIIHVVNQTLTSNVALLGTQGFVKTGAGTFQINGDQSISGPVVVQGGQLILSGGNSSGGAIGGASSISVTNTTVLSTGDNALIGWGAKTLPITLGVGSVLTGNGGSATNIQELTLAGGELGSASSTHPTYGSWNLNKNISVTENSIISALNVQFTLATPSISVAAGKTLTASGFFENSAKTSVRPLTKTGAGTMLMTGANSYTGATNINEGVLQLNGSLAAASVVTVAGGATFAGSGTAGTVTVNAGAVIAPGASQIGNLTTSTQSLAGTYQCQLSGSQSDQLVVNGNVTLTGASLTISAINPPTACSYTILTYSGTRTGSFASVPSGYSLNYDTPNQVNLIVPMSGYASWVASYGLAGNAALADADPDFDGITNGIEFVLGGNPATVQDQSLLPTMTLVTNPGGTVPNGSYVRFSYRRTAASLSVNPRVEFDADLAGPWTNATGSTGVVQEVVSDFYASPTMADRVDVFIPRALYEVQGKLFCRLVVTVP